MKIAKNLANTTIPMNTDKKESAIYIYIYIKDKDKDKTFLEDLKTCSC